MIISVKDRTASGINEKLYAVELVDSFENGFSFISSDLPVPSLGRIFTVDGIEIEYSLISLITNSSSPYYLYRAKYISDK